MYFRYLSFLLLWPSALIAGPHLCEAVNPNNNPVGSVEACSELLEDNDLSIEVRAAALSDRGIAYRELRRFEQSAQDLTDSLALVRDTSTMRMLAWTYREMGQPVDAEAMYSEILTTDTHWQGWLSRCVVRQDLERFEGALEDCLKALSQVEDNEDVLFFTARAYNFLGQPEDALLLAEKAISVEPDSPRHLVEQAWALHLMGRSEFARDLARLGLRRFNGDSGLLSFLEDTK